MSRPFLPNSTQIPNVVLDYWMAELSGAEFKVLMYIARRTYGFGKSSDRISLSQISGGIKKRDGSILDRGTGLSRATVIRAITDLVDKGLLLKDHDWRSGTSCPTESTFSLNICYEEPSSNSKSSGNSEVSHAVDAPNADLQKLVDELVEQGLNKFDALRLSDTSPEECRRQLSYLPFIKSFKSSKGAYLRTAIERSFGPPKGFTEGIPGNENKSETPVSPNKRRGTLDYSALWRGFQEQGGQARELFGSYLEEKRALVVRSRLAAHSPSMQKRLKECMQSEDYVLSQFEEWAGTVEGKSLIVDYLQSSRNTEALR